MPEFSYPDVVFAPDADTLIEFTDTLDEWGLDYEASPMARRFFIRGCPMAAVDDMLAFGHVVRMERSDNPLAPPSDDV